MPLCLCKFTSFYSCVSLRSTNSVALIMILLQLKKKSFRGRKKRNCEGISPFIKKNLYLEFVKNVLFFYFYFFLKKILPPENTAGHSWDVCSRNIKTRLGNSINSETVLVRALHNTDICIILRNLYPKFFTSKLNVY